MISTFFDKHKTEVIFFCLLRQLRDLARYGALWEVFKPPARARYEWKIPLSPLTPPKVSLKQPNLLVSVTEDWNHFYFDFGRRQFVGVFHVVMGIFHLYLALAGGLNTTHVAPYLAKSLTLRNIRKNITSVLWLSKKSWNHRALMFIHATPTPTNLG